MQRHQGRRADLQEGRDEVCRRLCCRHGTARREQALRAVLLQQEASQAGHVRRDDQEAGDTLVRSVNLSPLCGTA